MVNQPFIKKNACPIFFVLFREALFFSKVVLGYFPDFLRPRLEARGEATLLIYTRREIVCKFIINVALLGYKVMLNLTLSCLPLNGYKIVVDILTGENLSSI